MEQAGQKQQFFCEWDDLGFCHSRRLLAAVRRKNGSFCCSFFKLGAASQAQIISFGRFATRFLRWPRPAMMAGPKLAPMASACGQSFLAGAGGYSTKRRRQLNSTTRRRPELLLLLLDRSGVPCAAGCLSWSLRASATMAVVLGVPRAGVRRGGGAIRVRPRTAGLVRPLGSATCCAGSPARRMTRRRASPPGTSAETAAGSRTRAGFRRAGRA